MSRALKKFKLKHEYLILEEEDIRKELDKYVKDFENRFDKYYKNPGRTSKQFEEKVVWVDDETGELSEEPPVDESKQTDDFKKEKDKKQKEKEEKLKTTPKKLKALYKKLAGKMHPDRGGSDELFAELNKAFDEKDLVSMLKWASEYDIEYDITNEDYNILDKNLQKIENEINRMKNTLAWSWGVGDVKKRKAIIKVVESQTGRKVSQTDLPEELREKVPEKPKLLKGRKL